MAGSSTLHRQTAGATDVAIRRAIQASGEPTSVLARRYAINRKTVCKWRARVGVEDVVRTPGSRRGSSVLTREEEAIIVGFRKSTLLPLDDCLYALQWKMPRLTRSSLHRCLKRYGVSRLEDVIGDCGALKTANIGLFFVEAGETTTGDGQRRVLVATDMVSRLFYSRMYDKADGDVSADFLSRLIKAVPYRIHGIIKAGHLQTIDRSSPAAAVKFTSICERHGIGCHEARHDSTWSSIQFQRLSPVPHPDGTINLPYKDDQELRHYLDEFYTTYNDVRKLKTLRGLTPNNYVFNVWTRDPELFWRPPQPARS